MVNNLTSLLREHFGFDAFRPGQAEAIESVLAGRHTLVVMPTGAGKSLIYQFCALQRPGVTLVISPLIALMKDQVDSLARHGVSAAYINSTLTSDDQAARLQALAAGSLRLLYVAPERLRSVAFQQALRRVSVGLLAVDEAHCISQWGHDFRPDYLRIAAARHMVGDPVTVALTATATSQVQDDIVNQLGLSPVHHLVTGFNRPNLAFEVRYVANDEGKLRHLQGLLTDLGTGSAIIYVGTRRNAEEVSDFVRSLGVDVRHYHAGTESGARTLVQESFIAGDLRVVAATNAFGMGIDRPDVRMVVHYDLPGTLEAYYQEAGRAGRDGEPARAVLLYSPRDRALQEYFIKNDAPAPRELRMLHRALPSGAAPAWVTRDDLSLATGLPDTKIRLGMAQLEAAGIVEHLGDDGVRMLVRRGAWNEAAASQAAEGVSERRDYRRQQLAAMVGYAEANSCRRRIILSHFGDAGPAEAEVCCDNCLARQAAAAPAPAGDVAKMTHAERSALIILDAVRRLKWEVGREKLAQLLKGSTAKGMKQFGYDHSAYYGKLKAFTLPQIEDLIGQMIGLGHLKQVGGERPVLRLAPQGDAALTERSSINLRLPWDIHPHPGPLSGKERGQAPTGHRAEQRAIEREAGGPVALTAQMFTQGLSPAHIAEQRLITEDTVYNHLARLIAEGTVSLESAVPAEVVTRVRTAISEVGSADLLAPLKAKLPTSILYGQIRCVAEAWKREHSPISRPAEAAASEGPVAAFLTRSHPRQLAGPWQEGWALGFHSGFGGDDWQRSAVGDLTYRLKYESDAGAIQPLVEQAVAVCREHAALADVDAIIPVPPTAARQLDPVAAFAHALAGALGKPELLVLVKTRPTAPQKDFHTLAQKRANVAGAFAAQGSVRGKRLLVLDDLFDSGATLEEVTRVLRQAGAASVCVLTLTRTIHSDR